MALAKVSHATWSLHLRRAARQREPSVFFQNQRCCSSTRTRTLYFASVPRSMPFTRLALDQLLQGIDYATRDPDIRPRGAFA